MLKKLKFNGFIKTYKTSRTNTQKRCNFHYRGLQCKSRKSRNTWSNRQIWPWSTEWSRAKVNRVLLREHTGHSKQHLPTTQGLYTWTSPDGQYRSQVDYILCSHRWRSSIQSAKTRLGADYGSDHEPLIAKFRLQLKKAGKTTRPFRYDLNQIPYDYTVEVRNRFKGLDLIDRVPDELWTKVRAIVQETGIKTIPKKKKWKKAKWLSKEALQTAEKRREVKVKGEKERYTHLIARRDKKAFLSDQCKEIEENNRMGKTRDLKKIWDTKGTFHAKMGTIKDRNGMALTEAEDIKKRGQEYTEEIYKKDLHDPDNYNGVITHLEPDILECEVIWTKLVEVMEFQLSYFKS